MRAVVGGTYWIGNSNKWKAEGLGNILNFPVGLEGRALRPLLWHTARVQWHTQGSSQRMDEVLSPHGASQAEKETWELSSFSELYP